MYKERKTRNYCIMFDTALDQRAGAPLYIHRKLESRTDKSLRRASCTLESIKRKACLKDLLWHKITIGKRRRDRRKGKTRQ